MRERERDREVGGKEGKERVSSYLSDIESTFSEELLARMNY